MRIAVSRAPGGCGASRSSASTPARGRCTGLPGRGRRIDLQHSEVAGGHLIERFRLFFIIALGETVLTMGTAFTGQPFEVERLLALAALAVLALATAPLTLIAGIVAASAVLLAVAVADTVRAP